MENKIHYNRPTKTEKNYPMMVAGKEYILPEVTLMESRFKDGWVVELRELERINLWVAQQICQQADSLTRAELEFFRSTLSLTTASITNLVPLAEAPLSADNSLKLKTYFQEIILQRKASS